MSSYIQISTLKYPMHQGDIRLLHPEIGETFVCPDDFALIFETPAPDFSPDTQIAEEKAPHFDGAQWVRVWQIRNLTPEEIEQKKLFDQQAKAELAPNLSASGSAPNVI